MSQPREWFRVVQNSATPSIADIHIIDVIGSWDDDWMARNIGCDMGVTARAFIEQLGALADSVSTIRVHINSPGGDVQAGIQIANALRAQAAKGRTVETYIEGLAASIASVIAMAGSRVVIADNALMMVHNPWGGAIGDAREMRRVAAVLDTMRGQIIATYQWHSPMSAEDLAAFLDAETWLNAEEAIAAGLATEQIAGLQAAAALDPKAIASLRVPDRYRARVEALLQRSPAPSPAPAAAAAEEVLRLCREGECLDLAEALLREHATVAAVEARIADVRTARAAAQQRATQISGLCAAARLPELAPGYTASGMDIAAIQAHLTIVTAKLDTIEIDGTLKPTRTADARTLPPSSDIYAARRGHATNKES